MNASSASARETSGASPLELLGHHDNAHSASATSRSTSIASIISPSAPSPSTSSAAGSSTAGSSTGHASSAGTATSSNSPAALGSTSTLSAPTQQSQIQVFDMLPPPESTHASFTALYTFAQTHAAAHGYALSINTTAKNRARIKLACVCYGNPKNTHHLTPETRVRKNRASAKTGCKMWVEGRKVDDAGAGAEGGAGGGGGGGVWVLRVGEPTHNHEGRPQEEWVVHRRRTWGHVGAAAGGGVTVAAEKEAEEQQEAQVQGQEGALQAPPAQTQAQSPVERDSVVWKIVEQEMERGREPGDTSAGRDRGVGRTVQVLQEQLPGIQIFKRDVYNIRAQIKKAKKEAQGGDAATRTPQRPMLTPQTSVDDAESGAENPYPQIDPAIMSQGDVHMRNMTPSPPGRAGTEEISRLLTENETLKDEVERLKMERVAHTRQQEDTVSEVRMLRAEIERLQLQVLSGGRTAG